MNLRIEMKKQKRIPNPGSPEAIKQGCFCPILDNCHGKGAYNFPRGKGIFWINEGCPLHDKPKETQA